MILYDRPFFIERTFSTTATILKAKPLFPAIAMTISGLAMRAKIGCANNRNSSIKICVMAENDPTISVGKKGVEGRDQEGSQKKLIFFFGRSGS